MTNPKYGNEWQKLRSRWVPIVATGTVICGHPDCGQFIPADEKWQLGHLYSEDGAPLPPHPMHVRCNCATHISISDEERDTGILRPRGRRGPAAASGTARDRGAENAARRGETLPEECYAAPPSPGDPARRVGSDGRVYAWSDQLHRWTCVNSRVWG